jgi:hypothetical protein
MSIQQVTDLHTPIGEILGAAGTEGVVLEAEGLPRYAVMPLDDDLLDYLVERNPRFLETCRQIRDRMHAGKSLTHEDVKRLLAGT